MDTQASDLCNIIGKAVVARDFDRVHGLMAAWLQPGISAAQIAAMMDTAGAGLPAPAVWTLDTGAVLKVADLRKAEPYGVPSQALAAEVTDDNFRGWLCIQFKPADTSEFNVCFDVWLAAVEINGRYQIGYLEAAEAT